MTSNNIVSIAAMFLLPLLAVLGPILIGQRYGMYSRRKSTEIQDAPVGSVVGAALGLLAFMLAFTFQIVSNRYDARKELLLKEVTSLRTTYLRAGIIPEPFRSDVKKYVVEYVDLRVELANDPSKLQSVISQSHQILDTLWKYAEALAEQDRSSEAYSLYTTSVNELIDLQNQRISVVLEYRIPSAVLWVLFIITFFSMLALGYQFGISGKGNFMINLILSIVFAVVMFLVLALDSPEKGFVTINQKPMLTLHQQLHGK
jgi:ABC-type multidrug transport system fused ATPase/permease subunit